MGRKFNDHELRRAGVRNLDDAADILESVRSYTGLEWWIEAGTYLGMVREQGLIAHDSDIDFGIMGDAHLEEIRRGMEIRGFEVAHEFGTTGRGKEISFRRDGVKVDVFCFYEDPKEDVIWMGCWRDGRMIRLEFARKLVLPVREVAFYGVIARAPATEEEYLAARYGMDWRTPDPSWRWDRSPRCINWEKSDWTLKELEEKYP